MAGASGGVGLQADISTPWLRARGAELNPKQVGCREIIGFHPGSASG